VKTFVLSEGMYSYILLTKEEIYAYLSKQLYKQVSINGIEKMALETFYHDSAMITILLEC
jgi:hypothetical protein